MAGLPLPAMGPLLRRHATLLALIGLIGLVFAASASASGTQLTATLTPTSGTGVRLVLRNDGTSEVRVPVWLTGANGIVDPILDVTRNGTPVPYTGVLAKRRDPLPADMVTIAPGARAEWTLDVAGAYALSAAGAYAVQYAAAMPDGTDVASNIVGISASAAVASASRARAQVEAGGIGALAISYSGCGGDHNTNDAYASDQAAALAALNAANDYAVAAKAYFTSQYAGTRYVHWFGGYDASRWSTVSSHYTSIQAVTGGSSAGFDCSDTDCNPGTFAFVYPVAPYTVHLCSAFWDAALTGTDSRAGTLIHEISHFTVVAGTDDVVYGQNGAANLAVTHPEQAITNADSHEFFAENNPAYNPTYTPASPSYDMGSQQIGAASAPIAVVLTGSGTRPLGITSVSASGDFTVSSTTCAGTLPVSATCNVFVTFTPTASGLRSGTLTVNGNLDSAPTPVALSGIGTPPASPNPVATETPPEQPPAPPAIPTSAPALSAGVIAAATVTPKAPLVSTFTGTPGTTYGIAAKVGRRTVRGTCRAVDDQVTCTLRIATVGNWRVSITPTTSGKKGRPVTAVVRVRRA